MVYEGMRSMAGPFLGTLGASALTVGIITGAGEAIALVLRMVSGPVADRSGRYWSLTFWGYALPAIRVPLFAIPPFLGVAGLAPERTAHLPDPTGKPAPPPPKP